MKIIDEERKAKGYCVYEYEIPDGATDWDFYDNPNAFEYFIIYVLDGKIHYEDIGYYNDELYKGLDDGFYENEDGELCFDEEVWKRNFGALEVERI